MKPFKPIKKPDFELTLNQLPWIPESLQWSLSAIIPFLLASFKDEVSRIGLYGSWQRGDIGPESDVDLVVFLRREVSWFTSENGIVDRSAARKEKLRWHAIMKKANAYRFDNRAYSIAIVTPAMIDYFRLKGPIHLQNWAYALENCCTLWELEAGFTL